MKNLALKDPEVFQVSCFRSNLYYDVAFKNLLKEDFAELMIYIEKCLGHDNPDTKSSEKSCGIIYCRKKDTTESVARALRNLGLKCGAFHSGLKKNEKEQLQNDWMNGVVPVIIATVSFGMGIDKAQVRFVIHWDVAQSISAWYQESGRAGRDGKYSFCRTYYDRDEVRSISFLLQKDINDSKNKTNQQLEMAKASFEEFKKICDHCESATCRHKLFTNFFGDSAPKCDSMCDSCKDKKKCMRSVESFQTMTSRSSMGSFLSKPDLDPSDLYEGGRNNDSKKGSFENYDVDSDQGGFRKASDLVKHSDRQFIEKQFALRKIQAAKAMEQLPKTQINRVRSAQSTETKVSGLTISQRDSNLTFIIDALKKNITRSAERDPPEHPSHPMVHEDLESIGVQIEYKCFSDSKAISIYRRNIGKATLAIKQHSGLYPEIKNFVQIQRKSHGGEYKTILKEAKERYGADVVEELESENKKKTERKKKNKLEQSGRDGLSQLNIKSFLTKREKSSSEDDKKPIKVKQEAEASSSSNDSDIAKLELLKEVLVKELEQEETIVIDEPSVVKQEVVPSDGDVTDASLVIDESPIDKGDGFAIESNKRKLEMSEPEASSSKKPRTSEVGTSSSSKSRELAKKIISQMVIKELNPFYNAKKFKSADPKSLFKAMAREMTHHFCMKNPNGNLQKPEVKKYIGDIFKSKGVIRCEEDFK